MIDANEQCVADFESALDDALKAMASESCLPSIEQLAARNPRGAFFVRIWGNVYGMARHDGNGIVVPILKRDLGNVPIVIEADRSMPIPDGCACYLSQAGPIVVRVPYFCHCGNIFCYVLRNRGVHWESFLGVATDGQVGGDAWEWIRREQQKNDCIAVGFMDNPQPMGPVGGLPVALFPDWSIRHPEAWVAHYPDSDPVTA